jgi:excisionase family DNA binding protein
MSLEQQLLRPAQIAPFLGVSASRVYQLIAAGVLPSVRVGGSIRVPRPALQEWLKVQTEDALAAIADLAPTVNRQR